jgi:hypothetical protein
MPARLSRQVPRSSYQIERFTDESLRSACGIDPAEAVRLVGKRGDLFLADPGVLLHQGARCEKPRLVLFMTFTTTTPMSRGGSKTLSDTQRRDLYDHYQRRPAAGPADFLEGFFL